MKMLRIVMAAAVGLALVVPASAQSAGGHYRVQGKNLDGSSYEGTADITLASNTTCAIHWNTGGSGSDGICMLNQNAFAAGYVLGQDVGLVVYELMQDGSLHGLWTVAGKDGSGTEVLTPAN